MNTAPEPLATHKATRFANPQVDRAKQNPASHYNSQYSSRHTSNTDSLHSFSTPVTSPKNTGLRLHEPSLPHLELPEEHASARSSQHDPEHDPDATNNAEQSGENFALL